MLQVGITVCKLRLAAQGPTILPGAGFANRTLDIQVNYFYYSENI